MTTKVRVDPGACQKKVFIEAKETGSTITINIESDCPSVMRISEKVKEMSLFDIIRRMDDNIVYKAASEARLHPTCAVPCAILKIAEAELGLAVKKDIKILFQKEMEKS
ncbi:MAG: hypothetical protein QXH58_02820 [Nitrososphaerales archaeon]